jgi:hypothetical protein
MNAGEGELRSLDNWDSEDAIVVRPEMIVNVRRLSPGEAIFLTSLCSGNQLLRAVTDATAETNKFSLDVGLTRALRDGVFTAVY